jgi:hypothetical protein
VKGSSLDFGLTEICIFVEVKQEKLKQKLFPRSEKRGFYACFAWKQKSEAKLSETSEARKKM